MSDVVIVSAARTPIGKFGGALKSLTSVELGTIAAKAAIERAKISPKSVDQAILATYFKQAAVKTLRAKSPLARGLTSQVAQ